MNKYQLQNKTELGIAYYYCYGDDRFEKWLNTKNIKYKKGTEGKNLFEEKDKEIERLNNIINELEKWAKENNVNNRDIYGYEMEDTKVIYLEDFLDKLKELKNK